MHHQLCVQIIDVHGPWLTNAWHEALCAANNGIKQNEKNAGAHTIGVSRCASFRDRIYGDFELTAKYEGSSLLYLSKLKEDCPWDGGDNNTSPMDNFTPNLFDNAFFGTLVKGTGLLNSDQEMYSSLLGFQTSSLVGQYWADPIAFFKQFSDSMVKMGNIINPEGGEVRKNCRFVNT